MYFYKGRSPIVTKCFIAAAIAAAIFTSSAGASIGAERLESAEIRALFPGQFSGTWKGQHRVTVDVSPNGTLAGSAGLMSDTGVWSILGRKLCVTFKSWTKNVRQCGEVFKTGTHYIGFVEDGKPMLQFRKVETAKN